MEQGPTPCLPDYSSVVERLTADSKVPSSILGSQDRGVTVAYKKGVTWRYYPSHPFPNYFFVVVADAVLLGK